MTEAGCPFCNLPPERLILAEELVVGLWDAFPVSPGHALLVPRRHTTDWFSATPDEQAALTLAIEKAKQIIEQDHRPDGYNIGFNVGVAAGQTIWHLHLHLIPRYAGDVTHPRGGIRQVIPGRGSYQSGSALSSVEPGLPHGRALIAGGVEDPLLPHLVTHLDRALAVDIAVAFVFQGGVTLLEPHLKEILDRGGRVRVLMGDYLGASDPDALERLTDLHGQVDLRIYETGGQGSFHLKAYLAYHGPDAGTAFVGSSNLSRTALSEGVEWNYRVITSRDREGFASVAAGFEALFSHPRVRPLDRAWIAQYRARRLQTPAPAEGIDPELPPPAAVPHQVQREALAKLEATRVNGQSAGLVVLATGLGKTWLSAFDSHRPEFQRVLFVAHREEILDQARRTFRAIRPSASLGMYTGAEKDDAADVLFASIQTLSKQAHLERFGRQQFDYIIVDEFHHASARSYRALIDYFQPKFLLGLTATPERTDGGDLLALCGENLVYRCDMVEGIRRGLLAPFAYFGVPDVVDYENIPWRSTRFDEEALTTAVATQIRAENAMEQYRARAGERTIAFCVSQLHADFMAEYFRGAGLRAVAVHSGPRSAPRAHSLEQLRSGDLDVVFAVDMFNEGVDVPEVDTVMMLRPTESAIIWLQQFGRGLRWLQGKQLKVIDYIGNHRSFLIKPRTLLRLGAGDGEVAYALDSLDAGTLELPPGCSVTYDLEATDILRALLRRTGGQDRLRAYYLEFRERHGVRPSATEAFTDGHDPKTARSGHASWIRFVQVMGDLSPAQVVAYQELGPFLDELEVTRMTRSFKMVVLLAMLAEDELPGTVTIERLVERVGTLARRYGLVRTELGDALHDPVELRALLEKHPIDAWTEGRGTGGGGFFSYEGDRFASRFELNGAEREAAKDLIREIVDWRMAVYLRRVGAGTGADRIVCKVSHASGRPILFLPPRERMAGIPEGWVDVEVDGKAYQADFKKIAVNVLHAEGAEANVLAEVLRGWFGVDAGLPGSSHAVEFVRQDDRYVLRPIRGAREHELVLWQAYNRALVPQLFGFEFKGFESQLGVVERPGVTLLFVTLDKSGQPEKHRYQDSFLSPTEVRWQSQNKTRQGSESGQRLARHRERGITVHLFVRPRAKEGGKTAAFVYCGPVEFQRWEGEKPITVWWRLATPVPEELRPSLRVPL